MVGLADGKARDFKGKREAAGKLIVIVFEGKQDFSQKNLFDLFPHVSG